MDKGTLEVLVTLTLFLVNIAVILVFFVAFVSEALGLREKLRQRGKRIVRIVAEHDAGREADIAGAEDGYWWHHPSGVAVRDPPQQILPFDGASPEWVWRDAKGGTVGFLTRELPGLLVAVDSIDALRTGDRYRWLHKTTLELGGVLEKPKDVGGAACCWEKGDETREDDGAGSPTDAADTARAVAALRRSAPRETLNPVAGLAIEAEGATVAASGAATSSRTTAVGGVQRFVGAVGLKIGVARARRAAGSRRGDGEEEAGIAMRNRAVEL